MTTLFRASSFRTIRWASDLGTPLPTPFERGEKERPLRLTFHLEGLEDMFARERDALAFLFDAARETGIQSFDTRAGSVTQLQVDVGTPEDQTVPIVLRYRDGWRESRIGGSHQGAQVYANFAQRLMGGNASAQAIETMRSELLLVTAHTHFGLDLFVTGSEQLLRQRESNLLRDANPSRPSEALPIVALYLRSRGIYSPGTTGSWRRTDRRTFYELSGFHLLPDVVRCAQVCGIARPNPAKTFQADPLHHAAGTVRLRVQTALEALDEINHHFYSVQWLGWHGMSWDREHLDAGGRMLYHFDYLTQLLSGALDAQARVAHRVYGLTKGLLGARFGRPYKPPFTFRDALATAGAHQLVALIDDGEFQALMTLIEAPRNTIHDAALGFHQISGQESTTADSRRTFQVSVSDDPSAGIWTKTRIWEATQRLGSRDTWGIYRSRPDDGGIRIDPWLYANTLVATAIPSINRLAALIDAPGRLAVDVSGIDQPQPEPYDEETRRGVERLWGVQPT